MSDFLFFDLEAQQSLRTGVEKLYKLPIPLDLLKSSFFEDFKAKPADFDELNAVIFEYQI